MRRNQKAKKYNVAFPAYFALSFAHLALAAAEIAALPAALIFLFFFGAGPADGAAPLIAAHLAFWAARILALEAALNLYFFLGASVA